MYYAVHKPLIYLLMSLLSLKCKEFFEVLALALSLLMQIEGHHNIKPLSWLNR